METALPLNAPLSDIIDSMAPEDERRIECTNSQGISVQGMETGLPLNAPLSNVEPMATEDD